MRYRVQDPMRQLSGALQAKVKPLITQCCMVALYAGEKSEDADARALAKQAVHLAKTWERRKCNHKDALAPGACLEEVIGAWCVMKLTAGPENKHRYVLAADDAHIRRARRRAVPGLPIVHYSASVLVLEPMSDATARHIAFMDANKSAVSAVEQRLLAQSEPVAPPAPVRVKRKRAKEPNPLSRRKTKVDRTPPAAAASAQEAQSGAAATAPSDTATRRRRKKRGRGAASAA